MPLTPKILFEDTHLIVLDKPAGLLSQGERTGDENLVDWLRQYLGRPYVGLVHRLDRNTSGILVVAKRTKAAQRLTQSLQEGRLERTYLAWLEGDLRAPATWRHWLKKDEAKNLVRVVSGGSRSASLSPSSSPKPPAGAKEAVLSIRPVDHAQWQGSPITLAELKLETGRSHQIRAQSSHEGFPLLGDAKYKSRAKEFGRPALHSHRIRFDHPMSREWVELTAPLPADMSRLLAKP
jgi:23S rRNA pseudouridine1911/1915/1917 synthase